MDTSVLDTEKFDSVKELSTIQTQIAEGRAALVEIKNGTEAYIQERKRELIVRIDDVLQRSQEALRSIGLNQDALKAYAYEVSGMSDDLQAALLLFKEVSAKQREVTVLEATKLEEKAEELAHIEDSLKAQRVVIEADREANRWERGWIAEEKRKLLDERGTLERAFNRIK